MMEPALPDFELTICTANVAGLDTRCGASVRVLGIERGASDVRITIRCEFGHVVTGAMTAIFTVMDLVKPALLWLEPDEFRWLEAHVQAYQMWVARAAATCQPIDTEAFDLDLRQWAEDLRPQVIPHVVWVVAREHWDKFEKPCHPAGSWVPDYFEPGDWS